MRTRASRAGAGPRPPAQRAKQAGATTAGGLIEKQLAIELQPLARRCDDLHKEIGLLLAREDIVLGAPIQWRVKSLASIMAKLARQNVQTSSIYAVSDLIGIRIILLYRRDIERATAMLRRELAVEREERKGMDSEDEAFGYQSAHLILRCDPAAAEGEVPGAPTSLRAEVQIRTLAQHIWAAASHDLQYKKEEGVPKPLRRAIVRVSALLETVDLELDRVLEAREDYAADASAATGDFRLDVDILRTVLADALPAANRDEDEPYSRILDNLTAAGVETVAELQGLIGRQLPKVLERERSIVAALGRTGRWPGSARIIDFDPERLKRGAFYSHAGLVEKMLETGHGRRGKADAR